MLIFDFLTDNCYIFVILMVGPDLLALGCTCGASVSYYHPDVKAIPLGRGHIVILDLQQLLHPDWYWLCCEGGGQSLGPTSMCSPMLEGKIDNLRAAVTAAILEPLMQRDPK